jgi:D-alanyl-lipoteichoic acid acyltransferase DltB (MBOAT superfamily)
MAHSLSVRSRRFLLGTSIAMNVGILAFFKYHNFFLDVAGEANRTFGVGWQFGTLNLLVPVGLSFYTLQRLGYMIDIARERVSVERNFLRFATFVSFFPSLLSGPILRAERFLPQLKALPVVSKEQIENGLFRVMKGLFKKIVIADYLAALGIQQIFSSPEQFSSLDLLLGIYGYTFQLYYDFSGYTDIAIGLSMMLGFSVPENFNKPYLSKSIREFWRRWHMSLSTWLRDYLYIPLGGSHVGKFRRRFNLIITMGLCGAWHGSSLNFLFWGFYHGFLLSVSSSRKADKTASALNLFLCRFFTFHLVVFGWLLFRIDNMEGFFSYLSGFGKMTFTTHLDPMFWCIMTLAVVLHVMPGEFTNKLREILIRRPVMIRALVYSALIIVFCAFSIGAPQFIYFQF